MAPWHGFCTCVRQGLSLAVPPAHGAVSVVAVFGVAVVDTVVVAGVQLARTLPRVCSFACQEAEDRERMGSLMGGGKKGGRGEQICGVSAPLSNPISYSTLRGP